MLGRYSHIEGVSGLFATLKHHSYLLIPGGTENNPTSRLAHDALAPLIRERYRDSDALAQRAWRIVETKAREIKKGFLPRFSETDIYTITEAQGTMRKVPEEVLKQMEDDQMRYQKQRQDRFHLAFDTAYRLVRHLNYREALEKLRVAHYEKIHQGLVHELAIQLPYYFLKTGQWGLLKEALLFIKNLGEEEDPTFKAMLAATGHGADDKPQIKNLLLKWDPKLFQKMEKRHFPEMMEIKGGTFRMGSEEGYSDEKPVHQVSISSFVLAATPVTFWQYGMFCQAVGKELPNDSGFGRGDKPVINVNWIDAVKYCNWLSEWQGLEKVYLFDGENEENIVADWEKNGYRLATEAEWEYAAREGGKDIRFGNGKDVANPEEMNFDAGHPYNKQKPDWYVTGKGRGQTTAVKHFSPNALGLYDMSGNVYEWCWDKWSEGDYYRQSDGAENPAGPEEATESSRVVRGGSWIVTANGCRSSYRYRYLPILQSNVIGFRVVRRLF